MRRGSARVMTTTTTTALAAVGCCCCCCVLCQGQGGQCQVSSVGQAISAVNRCHSPTNLNTKDWTTTPRSLVGATAVWKRELGNNMENEQMELEYHMGQWMLSIAQVLFCSTFSMLTAGKEATAKLPSCT